MEQVTHFKRRLAAVAFADVAGWSLRVGMDDAATLQAWKTLRVQVIEPLIDRHDGRLIEIQGDALLIEFSSAVAAVNWAIEVQRDTGELGADGTQEPLKLRIGVNVEDVIVDDGKLIGDGVNIAARIHQAAAVGEIVATDNVRELVRNKSGAQFIDLGEQHLKHINRKIRVYRVQAAQPGASTPVGPQPSRSWEKRPAIAVLPFRTIGGDSEETYFGEGITEDIINALSRSHSFYVIARNSTLHYRGAQFDLRQIAGELGVRYILQGSMRRSAPRLRITCELVDATNLATLWSERFDGSDSDIFDFQDRIAASIVGKLEPKLMRAEVERSMLKPTDNLGAYDCMLRAMSLLYSFDSDAFQRAGTYLQRAIELDPGYAQARAWLAWWYNLAAGEGRSSDPASDRQAAIQAALSAIALDPDDAFCIAVAAHIQAYLNAKLDAAAEMFDRAIALNENSAFAWGISASTYCFLGRPDEALERLRNAWRLSPFDPLNFFFLTVAGLAEFVAGRYDQSIALLRRAQRGNPRFRACQRTLTAALAQSGDLEGARIEARKLLEIEPGFELSVFASWYPLRRPDDKHRLIEGLRSAGIAK